MIYLQRLVGYKGFYVHFRSENRHLKLEGKAIPYTNYILNQFNIFAGEGICRQQQVWRSDSLTAVDVKIW